jgi:hypothetical protein
MTGIKGVAFPIPKQFVQRFFEGRDVFVKPATVFRAEGICEIAGGVSNYGVRNRSQDQHL